MNPQILKGNGVALYTNPVASAADDDYGQFRATILHKLGFDAAEKEISGWPGYASTALHALPQSQMLHGKPLRQRQQSSRGSFRRYFQLFQALALLH